MFVDTVSTPHDARNSSPAGEVSSSESLQVRLAAVLASVVKQEVSADAHFFEDLGADSMLMAQFCARVRKQPGLPSVSIKDVYQHPSIAALAAAVVPAAPAPAPVEAGVQARLVEVLAGVMKVEHISVDAHFFEDLGADSMLMAQFCARVRKQPGLPSVSIKDVYQHPSIAALAAAVAPAVPAPAPVDARPAPAHTVPAVAEVRVPSPVRSTTRQYVLCGALQVLIFLGYSYLMALVLERGFHWIWAGGALVEDYLRSVAFGAVIFVVTCTLPILAKWVLIGRWTPREIPVWSLAYVRFWLVKTLVAANPLVLFAGSPLYLLYLRALGAKIGPGAVIFTRHMPVCTDLLTVGGGTVIEKDSFLSCYRAVSGVIQTGPVTIGTDVFIGEKAVLDIGTSLGDGAQLGHASSLHAGQAVPAGQHWHGSPGEPTRADYRMVTAAECGTWRKVRYTVLQLAYMLLLILPVTFGGLALLLVEVPWLEGLLLSGHISFTSVSFYAQVLEFSFLLFVGGLLLGLLIVMTVPRLLNLAIRPDQTYPLYGIAYACHRRIERLSNRKFFHELFGDSSYIVHYLQCLGYKLSPLVQSGSNFGTEVKHDNPYLTSIGSGTVVASGISIVNANYSSTSFSVSRSSIGPNNFLGNDIVYPPQGKTGGNCLIATKALVPIDGEVREGVGLLGSPAFEIPRTVARDNTFIQMAHDDQFPRRLAAKNRHNLVSMVFFLLSRWAYLFALLLFGAFSVDLYSRGGELSIVGFSVALLLFTTFYFALVERASTGFRGVKPKHCSIYDIDFWRTERFFKLCARANFHRLFIGTPFKGIVWRLLGVRVGRRLYDDGAGMSEKNIVTIGDDVMLNAGSYIQCHSQEDYAFKSDATTIGSGCAVGTAAMIHYGVIMGEGAVLAPDSFLMKGEEVPAHAHWGGNPALELSGPAPLPTGSPATIDVRTAAITPR